MLKKIGDILLTVGVFALAVFVWTKWGPVSCDPEQVVITQTDTIYKKSDPVIVVKEPPPKIITKIVQKWDTITEYLPIDTAAILDDYFSKNFYADTTTDDTTYWVLVKDTISRNRILYRDVTYRDLSPTQIIRNTYITTSNKFFIGMDIIVGKGYSAIMPTLEWKTRNDNLFGVGYDLMNQDVQLSFKTKIFER